jgi:hypothetical protein
MSPAERQGREHRPVWSVHERGRLRALPQETFGDTHADVTNVVASVIETLIPETTFDMPAWPACR